MMAHLRKILVKYEITRNQSFLQVTVRIYLYINVLDSSSPSGRLCFEYQHQLCLGVSRNNDFRHVSTGCLVSLLSYKCFIKEWLTLPVDMPSQCFDLDFFDNSRSACRRVVVPRSSKFFEYELNSKCNIEIESRYLLSPENNGFTEPIVVI